MLNVIDKNIKKSRVRFEQTVLYYPSRLCSCIGENNGIPLPNHTCNQGFYYDAPETIKVIRTQISHKYLNTPQGRILNGGATFTIPKYNNGAEQLAWKTIAHGDIIVVSNKSKRDTDVLIRGTRDKLYAFDVKEILSIYRNTTQYVVTTDFTTSIKSSVAGQLTSINWVSGKGPADGESYTVEFIAAQQFRVWDDQGQSRGTDSDELPKKVLCTIRRFVSPEANILEDANIDQGVY